MNILFCVVNIFHIDSLLGFRCMTVEVLQHRKCYWEWFLKMCPATKRMWCDLIWYSECRGHTRENLMSFNVNAAVQWPHRWVMWCRRCCLSWPKVKEKKHFSLFHGEQRHLSQLQSNTVDETGDFTKGVLSSLNKINETWSELVHSHTDISWGREAERTSSSSFINHTRHYTWDGLYNPDI